MTRRTTLLASLAQCKPPAPCSSSTALLPPGPPTLPEVTSMVVQTDTLETLVVQWYMPNKWTALRYRYEIRNAAGDQDDYGGGLEWPADQTFVRDVYPQAGGSYSGSGVWLR